MSPRVLGGQTVTASTSMPGWMVFGACLVLVIPVFVVWTGARMAAAITGGHIPGFGITFARNLADKRTHAAWPGVPTPLVVTCAGLITAVVVAVCWTTWVIAGPRLMHAPDDPIAALARHRRRHARLTLGSTTARAIQLRTSLSGRQPGDISEDDAGIMVGDLLRPGQAPGPAVYAELGRHGTGLHGAPGGKDHRPRGPPDPGRARRRGRHEQQGGPVGDHRRDPRRPRGKVWLFDPCRITYQKQTFWSETPSPASTGSIRAPARFPFRPDRRGPGQEGTVEAGRADPADLPVPSRRRNRPRRR